MKSYRLINNKIILIVALLMGACKKLISIPDNPTDKISTSQVFSDSINVMSAVNGVYLDFKIVNTGAYGFHNGGITIVTGLMADELIPNNDILNFQQLYNNNVLTDQLDVGNFWVEAYKSIFNINNCLEGVAGSPISNSLKKQLTGELKTVRALYYFNLVNLYGQIPLVINTDYKIASKLGRATVDAVYSQIIADLSDARSLLTPKYPSAGKARPNIYAATALLAKVYIYNRQWQEAEAMASEVINSSFYNVSAVALSSVFLSGSSEAIWQLPASGISSQTEEALNLLPLFGSSPNNSLSKSLLNAFEINDERKTNWTDTLTVDGVNYSFAKKYKNSSSSDNPEEDYMVFRLGELYLIRAEALAQQNKIDQAKSDLNVIRNRAGLPNIQESSQDDIVKAIMHERQIEMFCEWGNRWFDLKRTAAIDQVLSIVKGNWQPYKALWPIPKAELNTNPALYPNNPGYQ